MTMDWTGTVALAAGAGMLGGAMNALAGGGSFATLPALIAIGLPANAANASSNVALMPGAAMSAWAFRDELAPIGGVRIRTLALVTFAGGLTGAALLAVTPSRAFDLIIPWLLLFATVILAWGPAAAAWLKARVTIALPVLVLTQALLGIYGGYFGGGVGLMTTAVYGLLAGLSPRALFAPRTLMLAIANAAATIVFVAGGLVDWRSCLPMLAGGVLGGWLGARLGRRLPPTPVRIWTLAVTIATTAVFFARAYR